MNLLLNTRNLLYSTRRATAQLWALQVSGKMFQYSFRPSALSIYVPVACRSLQVCLFVVFSPPLSCPVLFAKGALTEASVAKPPAKSSAVARYVAGKRLPSWWEESDSRRHGRWLQGSWKESEYDASGRQILLLSTETFQKWRKTTIIPHRHTRGGSVLSLFYKSLL